jgi:hypothetical protein
MRIFLFILLTISIQSSLASEYILNWNSSVKSSSNFNSIMKQNECHYINIQEKQFKNKNSKNYNEFKISNNIKIQSCKQEESFSDEELGITSWRKVLVQKGFILSREIDKLGCKDIFSKQIPHMKKKNKLVGRNLNVVGINEELIVQSCIKIVKELEEIKKIFRVGLGLENYKEANNNEYNSVLKLEYEYGESHTFDGFFSQERLELGYMYKSPYFVGFRLAGAKFINASSYEAKPDLLLYLPMKYLDIITSYSLIEEFQNNIGINFIIKLEEYRIEYKFDNYLNQNIFLVGFKF